MINLPRPFRWVLIQTIVALAILPLLSRAQVDDFNDGNDDNWTRFAPLGPVVGSPSEFSFPETPDGGKAYRVQSPAPPVADAGPARSFIHRSENYSDFDAGIDIVDWNNDVNQAFGLLFRATDIGLGMTLGYVLNYDPQQSSGGRGQIQFNIVTNEADQGTIGAANLSFEPGHQYRIIMRAEGTMFSADVYDLNDLTSPLTSYWGTDDLYPSGVTGVFNFYRGGDATDPELGIADTTFDNFSVGDIEDRVPPPGAWRGIAGWPHTLGLSPLNRTAYHDAENGISFAISTLDDQPVTVDRVHLWLNGSDVTSRATLTPNGANLDVNYAALNVNTVYDARIEVSLPSGPPAVTQWTFDTFSQDFLESGEVEVVELEDYNFDGGQYVDNPPVSGFLENGSGVNANTGYVDREGIAGIDFFDYTESPEGDENLRIYRSFDPVATQAGASETGSAEAFSGPDPAVNDTIRTKYETAGLPEFQIANTEGGEWLNYTRDFPENTYWVYLRGAGRATQSIHLDQVTSNPSVENQDLTRLGTFTLPNMGMEYNYRFVQLLDGEGNPATLSLSGIETLRLSIGDEQENRTNETTALNYLAFVPVTEIPIEEVEPLSLTVLASDDVSTGYTADPSIQVDESTNTITLPVTGSRRFLSIRRGNIAPSVSSVALTDGNVVITLAP